MIDAEEDYANREVKYSKIIHCEMNAILNAREPLTDYTLYTYPFASCDRCSVHVIQAGIGRVVFPKIPERLKDRWDEILVRSMENFHEAGVEVTIYEL